MASRGFGGEAMNLASGSFFPSGSFFSFADVFSGDFFALVLPPDFAVAFGAGWPVLATGSVSCVFAFESLPAWEDLAGSTTFAFGAGAGMPAVAVIVAFFAG